MTSLNRRLRLASITLKLEWLENRCNPTPIVPALNSNPGAYAQLYLDFDGHFHPGVWCFDYASDIEAPVFSMDTDLTTFSEIELNTIQRIWQRVAEDYRPFNINVSTVEPSDFAKKHAMRVSIGKTPGFPPGIAGVACTGSFSSHGDNVAWVVTVGYNTSDKAIALVTSHEAGHTFGLQHQDNPPCGGYHFGGNYNGESKGPIMGLPVTARRELWWLGFEGCGIQDDMAIISGANNGFGYRADDHSDTFDLATRLRNNAGTLAGKTTGIITQTSDLDAFTFTAPAGSASITVNTVEVGPNLDTNLELYHDQGGTPVLIATADPGGEIYGASINAELVGGKYFLVVKSDGHYGEVGQYTISGTVASSATIPGFHGGQHLAGADSVEATEPVALRPRTMNMTSQLEESTVGVAYERGVRVAHRALANRVDAGFSVLVDPFALSI